MATIALYANKINQMPGLIKDFKQTVTDYKSELSALKTKTLTINKSVCNLDDVISSIQTSSQTQELKIASLDTFNQNSENFISDVVSIDGNVADVVKQRKDDFYDKYNYLKPECEKDWKEKTKDWFVAAGEWCKEHWKLIVTVCIVIVAIACLFIPGVNALVAGLLFGKFILAMAVGALIGAGVGGLLGGAMSAFTGGSFWEGFENGAFTGAIAGIISGGMGFAFSVGGTSALTFGQTLLIGGVSGVGISLISDLGDIFINGDNIIFGKVIKNMAISGTFGVLFAGVGYGISKGLGVLFKNVSWFSNSKELFRIGKTSDNNYGIITSYTTAKTQGVSLNLANRAGNSIFRVEFDTSRYLHYHARTLFSTKAHIPLSPIIDSTIARIVSTYFLHEDE